MSEKSSEDIKKICLICGCHTKQAINIYEPRNGPNIIELIQAKFKFQPVNDDKYLCYSCNNWLINWHSLQTLNNGGNESVGQSSKSRSHINESIPEEESCEDNLKMRGSSDQPNYHHFHNQSNLSNQKRKGLYFSRRKIIKRRRIRKNPRKSIGKSFNIRRTCSLCGRSLKINSTIPLQKRICDLSRKISIQCKNCRKILEWSANYSKILIKEENRKLKQLNMTKVDEKNGEMYFRTNLVNRRCQRPLIDGKMVAMLRRLGTTLTRESDCHLGPLIQQPQSPVKGCSPSSCTGKREMDDNEILIDFNTAITEVLQPFDLAKYQVISNTTLSSSGNPDVEISEVEPANDEGDMQQQFSLEAIYKRIPKCVTISVVNADSANSVS